MFASPNFSRLSSFEAAWVDLQSCLVSQLPLRRAVLCETIVAEWRNLSRCRWLKFLAAKQSMHTFFQHESLVPR